MKKYVVANSENGKSGVEELDDETAKSLIDSGLFLIDVETGKSLNQLQSPKIGGGEAFLQGIAEGGAGGFGFDYGNPERSAMAAEQHPYSQGAGSIIGDMASTAATMAVGGAGGAKAASEAVKAAPLVAKKLPLVANKIANSISKVPPALASKVGGAVGVLGAGLGEGTLDSIVRQQPEDSAADIAGQAAKTGITNILPYAAGSMLSSIPVPKILSVPMKAIGKLIGADDSIDDFTKIALKDSDDKLKALSKASETTNKLIADKKAQISKLLDNQSLDDISKQALKDNDNKLKILLKTSDNSDKLIVAAKKTQAEIKNELDFLQKEAGKKKVGFGDENRDVSERIKKLTDDLSANQKEIAALEEKTLNKASTLESQLKALDEEKKLILEKAKEYRSSKTKNDLLLKEQEIADLEKKAKELNFDAKSKEIKAEKDATIQKAKGEDPRSIQARATKQGALSGVAGGGINALVGNLYRSKPGDVISAEDPQFQEMLAASGIPKEMVGMLRDAAVAEKRRPEIKGMTLPNDPAIRNTVIRERLDALYEHLKKFPNDNTAKDYIEQLKKM